MFLKIGLGEIALICLIGAVAITLPALLISMTVKLNKRLRELEAKLKEK